MSAAPRYPRDPDLVGLRMTAEEFFALGETEARLELIDGIVTLSPSATPLHQLCVQAIFRQLDLYSQSAAITVLLDTDVQMGESLVYRPDISVYRPGRLRGIPARLTEAPDLAVEMLSPGSKAMDLITKRDDYERFGVGEYWAIDPREARVRAWHRHGPRLIETSINGASLASTALEGFVLSFHPLHVIAAQARG